MNWNIIQNNDTLETLKEESKSQAILIFKHSTSCSISGMALNRLERSWNDADMKGLKPYYIDLLAFRPISNQIAEDFNVDHQSPQAIVIKDGKAIYNASHMEISYHGLKELF